MSQAQSKTDEFSIELWRKGIHLSSLSIPLIYSYWLDMTPSLLILMGFLLFALFIEYFRFRPGKVHDIIAKGFAFMMREHELDHKRKSYSGATYVLLAAVIVILIFPKPIAVYAFTMLIIGDSMAALVGKKFGRFPIFGLKKTWEGSLAFFLSSLAAAWFIDSLNWETKILGALAATIIELLPIPVDDNLTIPVGSALVMWLFMMAGLG
ncbi:MAG: SEC59/DGK1/VTE5 family protein [Bacteroidetes bacterium]|nr:SEC59/DGK1/VTE5 family protein [Bacteroidota bacterium]